MTDIANNHAEPVHAADPVTDFSIYDATTGAVRVRGFAPYSMIMLQERLDSEGVLFEALDSTTKYVDVSVTPHVSKTRPVLQGFDKLAIRVDNTDAATMLIPVACKAIVDGVEHDLAAGPLVFTADSPGTYTFSIKQFPYQDFATTVVAS